ncbi:hypothetical protein AAG570_000762 [Ranatra chinensis]|uniref:SREBP regulating gene protein n=1 Tax=Ranatra chinensis TaxID=642074 RepID=A0ABD0ZLB1_9HEMI
MPCCTRSEPHRHNFLKSWSVWLLRILPYQGAHDVEHDPRPDRTLDHEDCRSSRGRSVWPSMSPGVVSRLVRRKVILGLICVGVCCCLWLWGAGGGGAVGGVVGGGARGAGQGPEGLPLPNLDSLVWRQHDDQLLDSNSSAARLITCRNSVQGKLQVVDDRGEEMWSDIYQAFYGYVCSRFNILASGCCDRGSSGSTPPRYSCYTCNRNGCCSIYEYCVACCLNPDKKELLQAVLSRAPAAFHVVFASVSDHYELCLAKCRTSSLSVHHENSYRDPSAKHCFTDNMATVQPHPHRVSDPA